MANESERNSSRLKYIGAYALMVVCIILGFSSLFISQRIIEKKNQEIDILLLGQEYRSSIDSLTQISRTYCTTGNPEDKRRHAELLGWWTGIKPRPTQSTLHPGQSRTSMEIARSLNSRDDELGKLKWADELSLTLIDLQQESMNARANAPLSTLAVFSTRYDDLLNQVHDAISDFLSIVERRNALQETNSTRLFWIGNVMIFLLLILVPFTLIHTQQTQLHTNLIEIQSNQEHLEEVMKTAEIGTFSIDINQSLITVSDSLKHHLNLLSNTLPLQRFTKALNTHDQKTIINAVDELRNNHAISNDIEFQLPLPKNKNIWLSCSRKIVKDNSQPHQEIYSGIVRNITDLKETRDQLSNNLERLRLATRVGRIDIFDWDIPNDIIDYESHGNLNLSNNQAVHRLNREDYLRLIHKEDRKKFLREIEKIYDESIDFVSVEYRIKLPGHQDWQIIRTRATVVQRDTLNQPIRVIGAQRDITEDRNVQERLHQSQKMMAIGQLAGGIAHDFNNQLHGLTGFAELMQLTSLTLDQRHYLNMIEQASKRCADLTGQLLAFARKDWHQTVTLDLNHVVKRIIKILQRTIDKSIHIETQFETDAAFVSGDPAKLENAVLNIALNSRDSMPNGGILKISTRLELLSDDVVKKISTELLPNSYVILEIADTGHGIPDEILGRIFEPFFTTKSVGEGTGLGLAAVYGTIQSHQGVITVESQVDNGTTFMVYLPFCDAFEDTDSQPIPEPIALYRRGSVLIADDEKVNRDLLSEYLTTLGMKSLPAADGLEALDLYKKHQNEIDFVILDLVMPKLNGRATLQRLLEIDPSAKVILISGHILDENVLELMELGALDFIGKPFTLKELTNTIRTVTDTFTPSQD